MLSEGELFLTSFLPLPPSLCADDSGSNVLRLYPRSPGSGLDQPCPLQTVPLLPCYNYRDNSVTHGRTACRGTTVWICLCASRATEAFVVEPLSKKRQLLLSLSEGERRDAGCYITHQLCTRCYSQRQRSAALLLIASSEGGRKCLIQSPQHHTSPARSRCIDVDQKGKKKMLET